MALSDLLTAKKAVSESKPKTAGKEKKKEEKPVKQTETKPQKAETKQKPKAGVKSFTAPFTIYLAAEKKDVSHIFEDGQTYSEDEITKAMLQHGFYEFSGNVKYDFVEEDNVLVPIFQQPKKG